ncbi:hypothetical protein A4X09_0g7184 [Tilletia walkeri]|uniref:Peptidase A1 domain-containing protein n=1 Tax=Tilletia walkeri TaxID=117179 RepID=A0A8X7T1K0_9BASI|nr:hypothetical protein A4X09_0g7184 [Tilletia walkeri]
MQLRSSLLPLVLLAFQLQVPSTAASSASLSSRAGHHPAGTGHHKQSPSAIATGTEIVTAPLRFDIGKDQETPSAFAVQVQIGQSTLTMALDAQFTDLVVNSGAYQPAASKTAVESDVPFSVVRNSAEKADGILYQDDLTIAGLTIKKFIVGPAKNKVYNGAADGLLGFAYAWTSEVYQGNVPFLSALKETGAIQSAVMGLALWAEDGEISLGGPNPKKFKGPITWVPVHKGYPFWTTLGKVAGVAVDLTMDTQRMAVNVPRPKAEQMFKNIPNLTLYDDEYGLLSARYPCAKPPQIMVEFGALKVPMGGMTSFKYKADPSYCVAPLLGVSHDAVPNGDAMAGGWLYSNLYVVVDMDKGMVGYALKA